MVPSKRLLFCLIDASSFIFRAFYAVRPLSNKEGLPTNAIFGFANMILKVLEDLQPTHIAFVYDTKVPSFRKDLFADYKANRGAMPEDLVPQIPYIKEFVEKLGLPAFEREGFEADDVIATLAERAAHLSKEHADVCIVSSDKDLMQLVNNHIYLYDTMKDQRYTEKEVKEKLGVPPELVADYLGIVGDSSDNIPGVKGIGPKGAVALLEQFGSLEGVYEKLSEVKKEGQRKQLEECKEMALLSKELATVKRDLPIETDWHSLRCEPKPGVEFLELLKKLEFHALEKRMQAWKMDSKGPAKSAMAQATSPAKDTAPEGDLVAKKKKAYQVIREIGSLKAAFQSIHSAPYVSLDTETASLQVHDKSIVGFSFCGNEELSYYVPLAHRDPETNELLPNQVKKEEALSLFASFLQGKKLVGQNIKFDLNVLRAQGIDIPSEAVAFDSMIASYILEPEARHNLDALSNKYLGHQTITYEDLCGSGKGQIQFPHVPIEKAGDYAAEDAHVAFLLREALAEKLAAEPALEKLFREIDLPLVPVLADMEWEGVAIDTQHLKKVSADFERQLGEIEKAAFELAGGEFNLSSPKQLQKILFEDLKLPPVKKTKTGFSTDVEVLQKLSHKHKLPALILEHRELSKLKGTYVDVLPELCHPNTNRVHAHFNQTIASTGRLSSSDPNLQNIPIRTDSGKLVRQAFIAAKGNYLLGADYSQIELRILASMSGDKLLTKAFVEGQDVHSLTATQLYGISLNEVTADQRRKAKAINFGLLYGKSAFTLSEELGISRAEAQEIIETYFSRYPTIRGFLDELVIKAKENGYAETVFGRRRYIEGIHSQNRMILAGAERMAVNAPIQGTAADLVKIAMIGLFQELKQRRLRSKLVLQVHDELVFEVPEAECEEMKLLVKEFMEGAGMGKIFVPLTVETGIARNWLEL